MVFKIQDFSSLHEFLRVKHGIKSPNGIEEYLKQFGYTYSRIPAEIRNQIKSINSAEKLEDRIELGTGFSVSHLSLDHLIEYYNLVDCYIKNHEKSNPDSIYRFHLFIITDAILRKTSKNSADAEHAKKMIQDPLLLAKVEGRSQRFRELVPRDGKTKSIRTLSNLHFKETSKSDLPSNSLKEPRVVKLNLESNENIVAGVGVVVQATQRAHSQLGDRIYSAHPLYMKHCGSPEIDNFQFIGTIHHFYKGQLVESSVYKHSGWREYAIFPSLDHLNIFNIRLAQEKVYDSTATTHHTDRVLYMGSAGAAFAAQFKGKSGTENVDVVHTDANTVSGAFSPTLKFGYGPLMQEAGLKVPSHLYIMHGKLSENHTVSKNDYAGLGMSSESVEACRLDLVKNGANHADHVTMVSPDLLSKAISDNKGISLGWSEVVKEGKRGAILNGVDYERYDAADARFFKELALKPIESKDASEVKYDIVGYRRELKSALYEAGVIAHPTYPLVSFVGRFAPEKGLDQLLAIVKSCEHTNVQFILHGICFGQDAIVEQLQEMARTTHKGKLKVYTTKKEQDEVFSLQGIPTGVSKISASRAAADFFTVTSKDEPCGLTTMEGSCFTGALGIASFKDGTTDIARAHGFPKPNGEAYDIEKDANMFCYSNAESGEQAARAFHEAFNYISSLDTDQVNRLSNRLKAFAKTTYGWLSIDHEKKEITGPVVAYRKLYEQLTGGNKQFGNRIRRKAQEAQRISDSQKVGISNTSPLNSSLSPKPAVDERSPERPKPPVKDASEYPKEINSPSGDELINREPGGPINGAGDVPSQESLLQYKPVLPVQNPLKDYSIQNLTFSKQGEKVDFSRIGNSKTEGTPVAQSTSKSVISKVHAVWDKFVAWIVRLLKRVSIVR